MSTGSAVVGRRQPCGCPVYARWIAPSDPRGLLNGVMLDAARRGLRAREVAVEEAALVVSPHPPFDRRAAA